MRLKPGSLPFTILLGALTAMTAFATDMSLPALPTLTRSFATSPERVQLTLSFFIFGYGGGQLFYGPLSDRFGRRPMLLAGLAIYTLSGFACAWAPSIEVLVAARLIQGLGGCVGPILGRAIVRDHYSGVHAAQMLSYVTLVFALAPMVAPLLGGALLELFGWPSIFLAFGVFGLLLLIVTWFAFAESLTVPDARALELTRLIAKGQRFFSNRHCVGYMLINSFIFAGLFAYISGSPFVFIGIYGVPAGRFGFYFALSALGIVLGALVNGRLIRRRSPERVLRVGLRLLAGAGAVMLLVAVSGWGRPIWFTLAMLAYVFAQGLCMPNAIAAAMEPLPDMAGMGASFLGAVQMLGGSLAGYAVNALYDGTPLPMAAMIAAMAMAALLAYYLAAPGISHAGDSATP
ncbi:MAG TPA: multidrug effflux MFS transporter [Stellaceae bacterium]|nr:multidrug effflux MFS transporter [Stellaceae bacterium]